jgi:transposase
MFDVTRAAGCAPYQVMEKQSVLIEQEEAEPRRAANEQALERRPNLSPKIKPIQRDQAVWLALDVENLVGAEHKIRAIWDLTGRMDLRELREKIVSSQGEAGQAAEDPRLLISIWIYAFSEGISSSRKVADLLTHEPALMWVAGLRTMSHATLANFRKDHQAVLDKLFVQLLGMLETAGVVKLDQVMHDGTKIRAQAGVDTFRREGKLRENLEKARRVVEQMGDPDAEETARQRAARQRARTERVERLEQALAELQQLQARQDSDEQKPEVRVSLTEPEARMMKHGDNAITPAYNAQISTDAEKKAIVGAHLSQCSSDSGSLLPALEVIRQNLGRDPRQVVADGGFTNRDTLAALQEREIDFIGSLGDPKARQAAAMKAAGIDEKFAPAFFIFQPETNTLQCPAGQQLAHVGQSGKRGNRYHQYRAEARDCQVCVHQPECCPKNPGKGRMVSRLVSEPPEVAEFRRKMETEEAKQVYRKRGPVAEFPNAWIKEKIGLRKFSLRGMVKAGMELTWACLSYNVMLWIRECWRSQAVAATA